MCGRTCLTLGPEEIICACTYKPKYGKEEPQDDEKEETKKDVKSEPQEDVELLTPKWRAEYNCGRSYVPSYNIAPTDICPVLVSAAHFRDDIAEEMKDKLPKNSRVIVPMMWGMIPFWHKGDYRKHGLTTNNCRLEHMLESKLYRGPFQRGQRCVILCEGFYEWQTTVSAKPSQRDPYFLYMKQKDGICIYDKNSWNPKNMRLLKLAGLYDIWEDENGDKIFSFSVITFNASKTLSWLHHRMPAILETDQQVDDWLDFERVKGKKALDVLRPATEITWHRVSTVVNNSRNKSQECNKPLEEKPKCISSNKIMNAFVQVRKRREEQILKRTHDDVKDENLTKSSSSDSENSDIDQIKKRPKFRDIKKKETS